jgi:hypothetical protein
MKTVLQCVALATLLWCASPVHAQEQLPLEAKAPTLQAGLSGFSFSKGSLDAALIMEIIAEKQQELKLKTIQNVFLSRVEDSGATVYTFVDNVVRELVFESDQNLRTKGILENAVNMAFVGAFLNYYLEVVEKDTVLSKNLVALADFDKTRTLFESMIEDPQKLQELDNTLKVHKEALAETSKKSRGGATADSSKIKLAQDAIDKTLKARSQLFGTKTITRELIIRHKQSSSDAQRAIFKTDQESEYFLALLLDMCSYAVREDKTLKRLGLLQTGYSETYEFMNLYLDKKGAEAYDSVYTDIQRLLTQCTDAIGALHYAASQSRFKFSDRNTLLQPSNQTTTIPAGTFTACKKSVIKIIDEIDAIVDRSTKAKSNFEHALIDEAALRNEAEVLTKLHLYLSRAEEALTDTTFPKLVQDILYTLHHDYIPQLKEQPLLRSQVLTVIEALNGINKTLFDASGIDSLLKQGEQIPEFLALVSKLYELDQATTISEYMRLLPEVSDFFPDSKAKSALSTVFRFVKDYTVLETDANNKEVLTFNAASFIYKLQGLKPDRTSHISFLFTVGLNTATFARPQTIAESAPTRNFSFVGEKIGLKLKIHDWAFTRGRNPGETYNSSILLGICRHDYQRFAPPKEPLISNWHVLAYGSGLLYNLVDAKTEQEFNMPVLAVGTGLTFLNGLDVNISCGVPIYNDRPFDTADRFYSLGFDIQFIEYYERLAQKRKNAQTQKRLAEAAREQ